MQKTQKNSLQIYNTLTRKKELFKPVNPPHVGLYVCGPTVYSKAHLGHARPFITFDILFRYLKYLGYTVRYVRNITDVGHLEDEVEGAGEDRIQKRARLEKLEPMEVVQQYTNNFRNAMALLNVLPPSIEPQASGHIIEQQQLAKKILEKGFAYEVNGSVYFDVEKYNSKYHYGKLSGRKIEDLLSNTRELEGRQEKHNHLDFALWKKAAPEHLMHWPSEWSEGFPGWHLECSAMGVKYLGETFDIHGGGMDLMFPHHECEIAQTVAAQGKDHVKYWMHNNMITINNQKMARSLGNFITLDELFTGDHKALEQAYSPMTIRFFMLQAHYRSTLDFSNDALQAAEKGFQRLMKAMETLEKIIPSEKSTVSFPEIEEKCFNALNDDLNTPIAISHMFDGVRMINSVFDKNDTISKADLNTAKNFYKNIINILGLQTEDSKGNHSELSNELIHFLLSLRAEAKINKNFDLADKIRTRLINMGIEVRDTKDGFEWEIL
ncbi:MAG: cysteine--tRNA ligase [Bacteroidales bacterium]|nr:cysteine--tRNA ligase [Bacteroidales bacterium]